MRSRVRLIVLAVILVAIAAGGLALRHTADPPRGADGHYYDPIEDDPSLRQILTAADEEALKACPRPRGRLMGYIHGFWATKKRILKEKYGVDWRSPAEMNPNVAFD